MDNSTQKKEFSSLYYLGRVANNLFRWFFLICVGYVILYPLIYMFSMAFRSSNDFYDMTVVWIPKNFTLNAFRDLLSIDILNLIKNTAFLAIVSSILQIIVSSFTGYGFARFKFKGNGLLFFIAILTIIVPVQMLVIPNYLIMKNLDFFGVYKAITGTASPINLLDNPLSFFVLAAFGQGIRGGLFILLFRQFYQGLPMELEEAAMIDGCGYYKTYLRIMLPNALTPMLVFFMFSLVWYWNDYYTPFMYLSSFRTLSVSLIGIRSLFMSMLPYQSNVYDWIPAEQAACIASILPLLILFVVAQKYFVQGIDKTGIVG